MKAVEATAHGGGPTETLLCFGGVCRAPGLKPWEGPKADGMGHMRVQADLKPPGVPALREARHPRNPASSTPDARR